MTPWPFRQPWRSHRARCLATAGISAAAASIAPPASAQVAVEAAVLSDYRVRGYSISDGHPAASISLNYDHPSGIYAGGTAIGTIHHGEPEFSGFQASAGYAVRLNGTLSLDAGVSRAEYYYALGRRTLGYTELYLGLALPNVSARLSYSPDYYRAGTPTLYAEVEGGMEPADNWRLSAHAGVFTYLEHPPYYYPRERYDWRVGASRQFGLTGLHLNLSGRVQGTPKGRATNATALVASVTQGF